MAQLFFALTMLISNLMAMSMMTSVKFNSLGKSAISIVANASTIDVEAHRSGKPESPSPSIPIDLTEEDISHFSEEGIRSFGASGYLPDFRTTLRSAFDTHFLESIPPRGADRPPDSFFA